MTIPENVAVEMYKILASLVKKAGAFCLCVNGVGNHVHLLVNFGPDTSRASLLQSIKQNSSIWARKSGKFPMWEGWGKEYYCFSVSADKKENVINYIKNQKSHHYGKTFEEEMQTFARALGKELNFNN